VDFLASVMETHHLNQMQMYTEISHKGKTYRAHPNYRNGGAWYDWAIIKFEASAVDRERDLENHRLEISPLYPPGHYPVKLIGFFFLDDQLQCLFHCTETKVHSYEDSCLTERWKLEYDSRRIPRTRNTIQTPIFRYCDVESIVDRVFCVEESPGIWVELGEESRSVIIVKHTRMWKQYFTDTS
jgi:hypothetical protein